jgi:hypothetical protein
MGRLQKAVDSDIHLADKRLASIKNRLENLSDFREFDRAG